MKPVIKAVLDACLLIPMPLADPLLRLARDLYIPKWTDEIMNEVNRNLAENFGLTDRRIAYRETEIRRHFPEAWVTGYHHLVGAMTNHPKDRHVLAASVHCKAEIIVTYNVKDFPRAALNSHSITALGPSTFLRDLYELNPELVADTLERQARSINRKVEYVLDRLNVNAPGFVSYFKMSRDRADRK